MITPPLYIKGLRFTKGRDKRSRYKQAYQATAYNIMRLLFRMFIRNEPFGLRFGEPQFQVGRAHGPMGF